MSSIQGPTPGAFVNEAEGGVIKVTAGGPGINQTVVTFAGTITNPAGDTTIYTVPAGKTLYVTDIVITGTAAGQTLCTLKDATTVIFAAHVNSTKGIEAVGLETQPPVAGTDAFILNVTMTGTVAYFLAGFVQ